MRWSLGWIAVVLLAGCARRSDQPPPQTAPPKPAPSPVELPPGALQWSVRSADGASTAREARLEADCTVQVVRRGVELWSARRCVAEKQDVVFVSDDGERLLVVHTFPKVSESLATAEAVDLYTREGRAGAISAGALISDPSKVRPSRTHVYWLAGVLGEGGKEPVLTPDGGAVELDVLDGSHHAVPFDAAGIDAWLRTRSAHVTGAPSVKQEAPPPAKPPPAPASESPGFVTWEDEDGVHYVASMQDVPPKFRSRATRTQGGDVTTTPAAAVAPRAGPYRFTPSPAEGPDRRCAGLSAEECVKRVSSSSELGRRAAAEAAANERAREEKRKADEAKAQAQGEQLLRRRFEPPQLQPLDDRTTPMCGGSDGRPCPGPGPGIP